MMVSSYCSICSVISSSSLFMRSNASSGLSFSASVSSSNTNKASIDIGASLVAFKSGKPANKHS